MRASNVGWVVLAVAIGVAGCAPVATVDAPTYTAADGGLDLSPALATFIADAGQHPATGADVLEVWVCEVPLATMDPTYERSDMRLDLDPEELADVLGAHVPAYFDTISHGQYSPAFVAGSTYSMGVDEAPIGCLDAAVAGSDHGSSGVIAIATAEHAAGTQGGFGRVGERCATALADCPATETQRGAYLGASDFHPDWGDVPALDLLEHEIGHLLDWPHSGRDLESGYDSDIDVMSNSAAPREGDSARRDAQDTLGINRLGAGWLDPASVAVASPDASEQFALAPSTGEAGIRLLVLPVDDTTFLTVEFLDQSGLNAWLPESGVVVTLVDLAPEGCADACSTTRRLQQTVSGEPPFTDLLGDGNEWSGHGWDVAVGTGGAVKVTHP